MLLAWLCLLLLKLCFCLHDEEGEGVTSDSYVIKTLGMAPNGKWKAVSKVDSKRYYLYYDIDLYANESIEVQCPTLDGHTAVLDPLDDGRFYNTDAFYGARPGDKMGDIPELRSKLRLSDAVNALTVEKLDADAKWKISLLKPSVHRGIETLYFDCIAVKGDSKVPKATLKLNIMPRRDMMTTLDETIDFLNQKYSPGQTPVRYFKFVRPGALITVRCNDPMAKGRDVETFEVNPQATSVPDLSEKSSVLFNFKTWGSTPLCELGSIDVCTKNASHVLHIIQPDENNMSATPLMSSGGSKWTYKRNVDVGKSGTLEVFHDPKKTSLKPLTCPNEVLLNYSFPTSIDNFVAKMVVTERSERYTTVDFSQYYTYRSHHASCINNPAHSYATENNITIHPVCDFDNPNALDMDGKTCSVFVSPKDFLIIRGITHDKETLNLLPLDQDKQVFKKLTEKGSPWNIPKLEVSNPDGLEPVKLTKEGTNLTHALYQFAFENIDHNPRYYAWSKDKKQGKGLHYDKIMAVHLSHNWITTGMAGELLISSGHEMVYKVPNKAQFYSLITRGSTGIKFNCSQFFKMKDGGAYKLYPEGKNTFFANVENGKLHPDKIPTMLFHEEFATTGVSIYKAPESEARSTFDLELKYDSGKAIWALHKKPIYFICAKPDWDVKTDSYAVIAVDPFFQLHPIYGCGTRPEFFLNNDGNRNTDKSCNFTLDGERTIGFFCPTPVPKHFLQKDQDQWKPADSDDFATENPYHKMVQCYDRSTTLQKILKPKVDIGLLTKPKSVGELRSLWIFSRSQFLRQGQDPILHILCHCFNVKGEVEASIAVSSGFRKYDRPNAVEPPIANAQTT